MLNRLVKERMFTGYKKSIAPALNPVFAIAMALTFAACGGAGTGGGNLSISSNSPVIAVSPSAVGFGSQVIGSSKSSNLILKNTGRSNLTVSNLVVAGTGFSLANSTLPL